MTNFAAMDFALMKILIEDFCIFIFPLNTNMSHDCLNFEVCQKDREPTFITINHRDTIKERAGAVRPSEVRG